MLNKELTYYTLTQGAYYEVEHADQFVIKPAMKEYPVSLWSSLLQGCLPPWLVAETDKELQEKANLYPDGQLLLLKGSGHVPIGGLSSIKTNWDGFADNLYGVKHTKHNAHGNTLMVTDLFIAGEYQSWIGVPDHVMTHLLQYAEDLAKKQNASFLLVSIPVTGPWFTNGTNKEAFEAYMHSKTQVYGPRGGRAFVDPNIQKYAHFWGHLVGADYGAVVKHVSLEEFETYKKTHKPGDWEKISDHEWHCKGTSGVWSVYEHEDILPGSAMYEEPHVWVGKSTGI